MFNILNNLNKPSIIKIIIKLARMYLALKYTNRISSKDIYYVKLAAQLTHKMWVESQNQYNQRNMSNKHTSKENERPQQIKRNRV